MVLVYIIGIFIVLATSAGFNLLGVPMSFELRYSLFKFGVLAVFGFIKPVTTLW